MTNAEYLSERASDSMSVSVGIGVPEPNNACGACGVPEPNNVCGACGVPNPHADLGLVSDVELREPEGKLNNADFFAKLVHLLKNYDDALLLGLLVAQGATEGPVRSTVRSLADNHLGGTLHRNQLHRASERLEARGLLAVRVYPRTYTEYTVPGEALRAFLAQPLPDAPYLPGVSQRPIPFLAQLQAESIVDAAKAGALPPSSEDVQ